MTYLELLAPAKNADIGIAAIDCGADAVYIAGPQFGARQAAGNTIEDIKKLCNYAHKYSVKIFVTLNTILYDNELEAAYEQMLQVQEAGADALIIQDFAILTMAKNGYADLYKKLKIPLHASTQCAIRTPQKAKLLEQLGFSRLILERQLTLEEIKAIREAVSCELEFFVHGALCVCYSGQCYLSENIDKRSANRGACIQACRSRYDLVDEEGRILIKDKALLSLKDYNLIEEMETLASVGISSFKIEGRLKNESYVRNVVTAYSDKLNEIITKHPNNFARASIGSTRHNLIPDLDKTFNRGYTQLLINKQREDWASMDAAKSMGEEIGQVIGLNKKKNKIQIKPYKSETTLNNGDGFAFITKDGKIEGFRGDICEGITINCKPIDSIYIGCTIYRNIDIAFEKELSPNKFVREIEVDVFISFEKGSNGDFILKAKAITEDGRVVSTELSAGNEVAENKERMLEIIQRQICKTSNHYNFKTYEVEANKDIPFISAAFLNGIRRELAEKLDKIFPISYKLLNSEIKDNYSPILENAKTIFAGTEYPKASYKENISNKLATKLYKELDYKKLEPAYEIEQNPEAELMRTKYCLKYELKICPKYHKADTLGRLFLTNNNRKFELVFDCKNCEMIIKKDL